MKRLLCSLAILLCSVYGFAQEQKQMDYRRSSLCLIMIDENEMPKRNVIQEAFLSSPVPDKYNDHNVNSRMFCSDTIKISEEDRQAFQIAMLAGVEAEKKESKGEADTTEVTKKKNGFGKALGSIAKSAASSTSGGLVDANSQEDYAIKAHKYIRNQKVAKQLFDKWFKNQHGDFSMQLIQERGMYDATVMDIQKAQSSVKGMGMLADAGEELINNTFVVVTRYRYISKEELCKEIEATAQSVASTFGSYATMGTKAAMIALKASLGAGYYVRTTSYLYQLNWNDSIAQTFYGQLWSSPEMYENSDIFGVNFIGKETAWANVKAGIFTNKDETELIRIATVNAMDAVLAKLEKKYEVFKTKTPVIATDPSIIAQIGLKEGIEAGDKFEVLEKIVDPETSRTSYKRKAVVKVSKDQIWDNRYMANEELELAGKKQDFQVTRFEGNDKNMYPGMLLRQIK